MLLHQNPQTEPKAPNENSFYWLGFFGSWSAYEGDEGAGESGMGVCVYIFGVQA